jgi:hypothetical protein
MSLLTQLTKKFGPKQFSPHHKECPKGVRHVPLNLLLNNSFNLLLVLVLEEESILASQMLDHQLLRKGLKTRIGISVHQVPQNISRFNCGVVSWVDRKEFKSFFRGDGLIDSFRANQKMVRGGGLGS